ncbi:MAG: PilZ domain-containing protein [Acidobacteria bacterium]|nr:PilZ domain-containing protein [Acidobacteriota bacterium]
MARPLRGRRLRPEDLSLRLTAIGLHGAFGKLHGVVADLSNHGLALVLMGEAGRGHLILLGDRIEHLAVNQELEPLHRGAAIVRRVERRGSDLWLGLELDPEALDLAFIYHLSSRASARDRWREAVKEDVHDGVPSAFRAWVFELKMRLERAKRFLESEGAALASADLLTRERGRQDLLGALAPEVIACMDEAGANLERLVGGLDAAAHDQHRRLLKQQLLPLLSESPFLRRAFEKPLGYAGDFEMMNMLYRDHAEGASLFGQCLNIWATQTPVAQANINRLQLIREAILDATRGAKGRVKIMSIGCGPAWELLALLTDFPDLGPHLEIGLIDQGEGAITHCERTLGPLAARTGAKLKFHRESIRRFLTVRESAGTFGHRHLIYSGGLFDYLGDRAYKVLLKVLYDAVLPGGRLLLGNVAAHNPSRWAMEYFVDWSVIHRAPEELKELASHLKPSPSDVRIEAEPSGINLFLHILK